jgi:hypothetical protein
MRRLNKPPLLFSKYFIFFNGGGKDIYDYSYMRISPGDIIVHRVIYNPGYADNIGGWVSNMVNKELT